MFRKSDKSDFNYNFLRNLRNFWQLFYMKKIMIVSAGILLFMIISCGLFYYRRYRLLLDLGVDLGKKTEVRHLGIIMDGNRRWAKKQGLKPWLGHKQGVEPVKEAIEFCLDRKIPYLTLYVFSLENFKRPQEELNYLFDILAQEVAKKELQQLFEKGVKVRFVGDRSRFPESLHATIADVEERTKNGTELILSLLFCYGGQQEIVAAARDIAEQVKAGTLESADITEELFRKQLWMGDVPYPDFIIRTAGDQRMSNFLTFQAAYSELCFVPWFWPEMTKKELARAVDMFNASKRNFGA